MSFVFPILLMFSEAQPRGTFRVAGELAVSPRASHYYTLLYQSLLYLPHTQNCEKHFLPKIDNAWHPIFGARPDHVHTLGSIAELGGMPAKFKDRQPVE